MFIVRITLKSPLKCFRRQRQLWISVSFRELQYQIKSKSCPIPYFSSLPKHQPESNQSYSLQVRKEINREWKKILTMSCISSHSLHTWDKCQPKKERDFEGLNDLGFWLPFLTGNDWRTSYYLKDLEMPPGLPKTSLRDGEQADRASFAGTVIRKNRQFCLHLAKSSSIIKPVTLTSWPRNKKLHLFHHVENERIILMHYFN